MRGDGKMVYLLASIPIVTDLYLRLPVYTHLDTHMYRSMYFYLYMCDANVVSLCWHQCFVVLYLRALQLNPAELFAIKLYLVSVSWRGSIGK